jgi:hypothetical protein
MPPPPHVCGAVQLPQLSVPPHPSLGLPQLAFRSVQVFLVQVLPPHWWVAPQLCPVGQTPQFSVPPQPSLIEPHAALSC